MKLTEGASSDPTALCEISLLTDRVRRSFSGGPFRISQTVSKVTWLHDAG